MCAVAGGEHFCKLIFFNAELVDLLGEGSGDDGGLFVSYVMVDYGGLI